MIDGPYITIPDQVIPILSAVEKFPAIPAEDYVSRSGIVSRKRAFNPSMPVDSLPKPQHTIEVPNKGGLPGVCGARGRRVAACSSG